MRARQALEQGREAFKRRAWKDAYRQLKVADEDAPLKPADLECLATAAYLVGEDAPSAEFWARAHQAYLSGQELERAVRCAIWLVFGLMHKGERARAAGWLARAQRLLAGERDCVEQGYLQLFAGYSHLPKGELDGAYAAFCQAAETAARFADADLVALARHCRGRMLIMLGETERGVRLLDEAMAAIEAGDVSAMAAGDVYCSVIEGCLEVFDLRRAQEWTAALTRWCESQPDLVPYRGQCLVRRAEIMHLRGTWPEALAEAQRAGDWLSRPPGEPAAAAAFYQQAELHRLRGELAAAEACYRDASMRGRVPQPGLALLRLAQGQVSAAEAAVRSALAGAQGRPGRARLLPAFVEIMLLAGDRPAAHAAAEELAAIAKTLNAPLLQAHAMQAWGAVLLAEGTPEKALAVLRQAWRSWRDLEVPYEGAKVRVLLGLGCRTLGDEEAAVMEFEAAHLVFGQLGAAPDLARVEELLGRARFGAAGLTPRELEVLRLVAAGKTNKAIAAQLSISERTVERHVSNIFDKLGVSSRAAATAYAYEHRLV